MKNNNHKAIELVLFKAKPGLNQQDVKNSLESINSIVTNYKGFISRQLARNEDGQWMDMIIWESMENAKDAADNIMKLETAQKAFSVIDEQTMKFYHFDPISRYSSKNEYVQHTKFKSTGEFLDFIPEEERKIVVTLQKIIFECMPEYDEKLSYNVPFYYRNSRVCYIWPSSIPWGGIDSGVAIGFCRGNRLSDEINYLEKGNRKYVFTKTFNSINEIEPDLLKSYLYEAIKIDEMTQNL